MSLPNFICLGAQKSGTTTLHNILMSHPGIYLPGIKETKFFCDDVKFSRGLEFYQREFFSGVTGEPVRGEIDPDYLYSLVAPRRMRESLGPGLRLVVMLRNPVDRAYSHYLMTRSRGYETESFETALRLEVDRIERGDFEREHFSYADRGRYAAQIRRFSNEFPLDQMFFVVFETDFLNERGRTLRALLGFLGAEQVDLDLDFRLNRASTPRVRWIQDLFYKPSAARDVVRWAVGSPGWKTKIRVLVESLNRRPLASAALEPAARAQLMRQYFSEEAADLGHLIGRDLSFWNG